MRRLSLVLIAVLASAAPAFAQNQDSGDVSIKATEPPIDRTANQRGTIGAGANGVGGSVLAPTTAAPMVVAPATVDTTTGKTQ